MHGQAAQQLCRGVLSSGHNPLNLSFIFQFQPQYHQLRSTNTNTNAQRILLVSAWLDRSDSNTQSKNPLVRTHLLIANTIAANSFSSGSLQVRNKKGMIGEEVLLDGEDIYTNGVSSDLEDCYHRYWIDSYKDGKGCRRCGLECTRVKRQLWRRRTRLVLATRLLTSDSSNEGDNLSQFLLVMTILR